MALFMPTFTIPLPIEVPGATDHVGEKPLGSACRNSVDGVDGAHHSRGTATIWRQASFKRREVPMLNLRDILIGREHNQEIVVRIEEVAFINHGIEPPPLHSLPLLERICSKVLNRNIKLRRLLI